MASKYLWEETLAYVFANLGLSDIQAMMTEEQLRVEHKVRFGIDCEKATCRECLRLWVLEETEWLFS